MNRQVRRVGLALTVMFIALFAIASSIQVVRTQSLYQDARNVAPHMKPTKRSAVRFWSVKKKLLLAAL